MNEKVINQYSGKDDFQNPEIEQKILDRSARFKVPDGISREEALSSLKARILAREKVFITPKKDSRKLIYMITSLAAGLLLLFGLWHILINNHGVRILAEKGTHLEYKLPDGSIVRLNADSKIIFRKKNFSENRNLNLEGEGFFEVTKGSPFTISTDHGFIRVLGTSFNVYTRDDLFRVSCVTGKVLVSEREQSVTITRGESASFSGETLVSFRDDNLHSVTGWLNGEFNFINSPLNFVFDEVERQFNVNFVIRKPEEKFFTGSFTNKDLKIALDIICIPMGLRYEIGSNREIFIDEDRK